MNINAVSVIAVKRVSSAVGGLALVALGAASALIGGFDPGPGPRINAGSGSAPTNTVYIQPVVSGMSTGATATWAAPASTPSVEKAVPGQ